MSPASSNYFQDPYPEYEELRGFGPMHWNEDVEAWIVTGYAEAKIVLANDDLSSDWLRGPSFRQNEAPVINHVRDWLMWMDPPQHKVIRSAISPLFSQAMTATRARLIESRVADHYDRFVGDDGGNAVDEFAVPLATDVVAEVAGLRAATSALRQWSSAAGALMAKPHHAAAVAQAEEAFSRLAEETVGHGPEKDDTVVGRADVFQPGVVGGSSLHLATLFAFAGIETTSQAVARLLDLHASGSVDPAWPAAVVVNELLRYDTPVPQIPRVALRDTKVGIHRVHAGQAVLVILAAANRDPGTFSEPAVMCPRSDASRHVAYGHGRHRCLGASLAHQLLISVAGQLGRHPRPRRVGPTIWHRDRGYRGIERLDLVYAGVRTDLHAGAEKVT